MWKREAYRIIKTPKEKVEFRYLAKLTLGFLNLRKLNYYDPIDKPKAQ